MSNERPNETDTAGRFRLIEPPMTDPQCNAVSLDEVRCSLDAGHTGLHARGRLFWRSRPTQETDPRPDPLPYGHNPFMTARDEANEPDYLNRPTQETDPE